MANWSNPTLTSLYTDFVTEVKNRDVDLALGLDPATTSPTNVPTNAIRWNSANSRWEKYTSGSWGTLTATYALTSLSLTGSITFEGATDDAFETTLTVADPTADRTITLPNVSGTVVTTGDTGSITSTMIADGTIVNADINASAAIAGTKISPDFGSQNVTTTGTSTAAGFIPSSATVPSNGLYLPAANQLGFSTASTSRLVLDASGNLGLGVVPSAWSGFKSLDLFGSTGGAIASTNGSISQSSNTYYNGTNWIYKGTGFATRYEQLGGAAGTSSHAWYTAPSWNGTGSDVITFTQAMTLDASGRLLVGTSSARANFFSGNVAAQIQLEGNSTATSSLALTRNDNGADGNALILSKARSTSYAAVQYVNGTTSDDRIGRISFQGADGTNLIPAAEIECFVDATPGANDMPGRLVFSTTADGAASPTERMRIDNAGTTTFSPASATSAQIINVTNNVTAVSFRISNTQYGYIQVATTGTTYSTSSDYRIKENVTAVTDGITRLQQLKPSRFNFITDPDKTVDGFIAHEVQAVVPEAITGEKDAIDNDGNPIYQGIDQSKLVPLLTAALQEAIAKIESLESRLTAAGI